MCRSPGFLVLPASRHPQGPSLPAIPDGVMSFGAASFASCCGPYLCPVLRTGSSEMEPRGLPPRLLRHRVTPAIDGARRRAPLGVRNGTPRPARRHRVRENRADRARRGPSPPTDPLGTERPGRQGIPPQGRAPPGSPYRRPRAVPLRARTQAEVLGASGAGTRPAPASPGGRCRKGGAPPPSHGATVTLSFMAGWIAQWTSVVPAREKRTACELPGGCLRSNSNPLVSE